MRKKGFKKGREAFLNGVATYGGLDRWETNRGLTLAIAPIPYLSSHALIRALNRALDHATDSIHQIRLSPNPVFGNPIYLVKITTGMIVINTR